MAKNIGIIGTGIAALAAAARLAAKGHTVTCFEANSYPGGKLTSFTEKGFRFDTGPSLFTLPQLVDDVFLAAGKNPRTYFNYTQKNIACHYFFSNGKKLTAWADQEKLAAEIEHVLGEKKEAVLNYLKSSEKKYDRVGKIFLERSLHKMKTWLRADVAKALLFLPSYKLFSTMHKVNTSAFKHPETIQLFNRYATYNGSNPYAAPGLLTMIPHLEHGLGTFLPDGGMQDITNALYKLCTELGVHFHFSSPVEKILTSQGKTNGMIAKGKEHAFDIVVCNMDVVHAYRKLLSHEKQPEKTLKQERSSSALIFYWGVQKEFPALGLHNIFFSKNYEAEFASIFTKNEIYDDPTVYINITSKEIKTDAPQGCENWFVMINVPANRGYFTDAEKTKAKEAVVRKINTGLQTDIRPFIVCEKDLDPVTIEAKTSSLHGSLYGTSSNNRMAAFKRHPNFSSTLKNLYFCGGSVHPGGGIPLCLNSAKIVSELI